MRTDDSQLVARAVLGDDEAFAELMGRYRDAVCAIAYSYLGNFEDVQDVAQETFIQACSQLKHLREPEKFGAWLRRIATNCAGVLYRRRRSTVPLDQVEEARMPVYADEAEQGAARIVVRDALNRLSEKARITTTLFYINGYTHSEVADLLEIPVNTVRSRLQSARKQLSEEMITMVKDVLNEEKRKVTLDIGKHTLRAEPVEKTGDDELDAFLFSLTSVLDISFQEYIRSVYLVKTYMYDGLLPLCIVIKDDYDEAYRWKAWSLVDHATALSQSKYRPDPLYLGKESPFYSADDFGRADRWPCTPIIKLGVKEDSLLLWGEDIRDRIALPDSQAILKDVLMPPFNHIKQTHYARPDGSSALGEVIVYPLSDPAPERNDIGYGDSLPVAHIARALIYMETGKFVFDRHRLAAEFASGVGGPWAGFVADVLEPKPDKISESEQRKARVRVCRQFTAFKNYFLEQVAAHGVDVSADVRMSQ